MEMAMDGGGGAGTNMGNASAAALPEDIRLILTLKNIDPDLNEAWTALLEERFDDMYAAIYRSKFYTNNTRLARQRQAAKQRQEGAYKQELNSWVLQTKKRLTRSGVKVTPAVEAQLETAYLLGMDDNQVDNTLSGLGLVGTLTGETGGEINTLKSYARQFGVDNYYNQAFWDEKGKELFQGTTTPEDIQAQIRTLSSSMYPSFAEDINAGRSLEASASYVTTILGQRLGRPISISSPEAKQFLQWSNPQTGKAEKAPGWYIERESWKLPGADMTNDAIAKADNIAVRVLRDMGLM